MKARLLKFPAFDDERGRVVPIEHSRADLPFVPVRSFVICNVPKGQARAEHNVTCDEAIAVVNGSLTVTVKDAGEAADFALTRPGEGLYVPEGAWIALRDFSEGAVVLVVASKPYGQRR